MERTGGNPHDVYKDVRFRTIPDYFREMRYFDGRMRRDLIDAGFDVHQRQIAHAILKERFGNSLNGMTYKAGFLSLLEPGLPANTAGDRAGAALFIGTIAAVDDIIDDPLFPKFETPEELKMSILDQEYRFKGSDVTARVSDLLDLSTAPFDEQKRGAIADFIDAASNTHWEYSGIGQPGEYGFSDALDYRKRTTCDWVYVLRELLNVPQVDDLPLLGGQLLDDAVDLMPDAKNNRLNLFVGMANDMGEIEVLVDELSKTSSLPNVVRGKILRRKMPKSKNAYTDFYKTEFASKVSRGVRTLGRSLEFVI